MTNDKALMTAWAAGVFEGEGCIINRIHYRGERPIRSRGLVIQMTDRDVLERVQAAMGCGKVTGPFHRGNSKRGTPNKPQFKWTVQQWPEVQATLEAWMPYLCERRRQAALDLLAHPAKPVGSVPKDTCKRGHPRTRENIRAAAWSCRLCDAITRKARRAAGSAH